jgi:hypothetical protein
MDSVDRGIMENVFLFLAMDSGELTPEQWGKFDHIGSSFKGFKRERRRIIEDTKESDNELPFLPLIFSQIGSSSEGFKKERRRIIEDTEESDNELSFSSKAASVLKNAEACMPWDDEAREIAQKKMIWTLTSLLYYYGEYSDKKRDLILSLAGRWGLDESIFYEMKDTAETFAALAGYQNRVESCDEFLKNELDKNKNEIDKSLKELIELG